MDVEIVDRVVSGMRKFSAERSLGKPSVIHATEYPIKFCGGLGCEWQGQKTVRQAYAFKIGFDAELAEAKRQLEAWES